MKKRITETTRTPTPTPIPTSVENNNSMTQQSEAKHTQFKARQAYMQFTELRDALINRDKQFDAVSLKMLRYGDLDLAAIGNALKAACSYDLVETERASRIESIKHLSIEEVEADKGKWEILDDIQMYYAYYRSKVVKVNASTWPKWRLLVKEMKNLRGDWSEYRDSPYLRNIYKLIPEVIAEGIVPEAWCRAVERNADQFDGHMNDGRIMRDGSMYITAETAKYLNLPVEGNVAHVSGNLAKMMGSQPEFRNGYRGSYEELFRDILTPEQKVTFLEEEIGEDSQL
jgi:hypothetical protein